MGFGIYDAEVPQTTQTGSFVSQIWCYRSTEHLTQAINMYFHKDLKAYVYNNLLVLDWDILEGLKEVLEVR